MPIALELLGMDHGHAAVVGELPQILGPAADADLDGALGVQHARQHRLPERPAVVELGALEGPAGVAMGIDVHQSRPAALAPTAFRIGSVIEWSPPTLSGATPAATSLA